MKSVCKFALVVLLVCSFGLAGCGEKRGEQPAAAPDHGYTLTAEQLENYQSSVSYVLKRESQDMYLVQYSKCGTILSGDRLVTDFDGMVVQVSNGKGESYYPALKYFKNEDGTVSGIGTMILADFEKRNEGGNAYTNYQWMFCLDKDSGTAELKAMLLTENGVEEWLLKGEGTELADFGASDEVSSFHGYCYVPTYGDDGSILPLKQWDNYEWYNYDALTPDGDLAVNYVPLKGGDYYVIYEITDQEGNTYCTEMIPYETEKLIPPKVQPEIFVKWEKDEREVLLLEENDLEVYLSVEKDTWGDSYYGLKVKNNTGRPVRVGSADPILNGNVSTIWWSDVEVEPGKLVADSSGASFGVAFGSPEVQQIESLQFVLTAKEVDTFNPLLNKVILVDMTDAWPLKTEQYGYYQIQGPVMDALATEQVLLESDQLRLTLMGAGTGYSGEDDLNMLFKLENHTEQALAVSINAVTINGGYVSAGVTLNAAAGGIAYQSVSVYDFSVEEITNPSIETISVLAVVRGQEDWLIPSEKFCWLPIMLAQAGKAEPFSKGQVLWEEGGCAVGLRQYNKKNDQWQLTLSNTTQRTVRLYLVDGATGKETSLYLGAIAGPGQYNLPEIDNTNSEGGDMTVRFRIYDYETDELLLESDDVVLKAE